MITSEILQHSFTAVLQAKRAIDSSYPLSLTEALELERNMCAVCFASEERKVAMTTFVEKNQKK